MQYDRALEYAKRLTAKGQPAKVLERATSPLPGIGDFAWCIDLLHPTTGELLFTLTTEVEAIEQLQRMHDAQMPRR